ncbi:SMP-30/gluconolactonase/LRE family protein [Paramicrobacterium humi]|uniref:SMP-30/gluconolactonase/LRE family protein n=1 Tax=Paramicrobacterium humi TaxID=640635 RepID=UPI000B873307|nr:SMP-30/gluconolactonase/LRE family protein [Microbacterium humi]
MNDPSAASDLIAEGAELERLWTGAIWSEGPVWLPALGVLRWSDIPNSRILEFDASTGQTRVHRDDVEFTNGRTLDLNGDVVQCSHGRRAIEREVDGVPRTVVDRFGEARLNSPNDVVVRSDGSIWFTDPPYGIIQPNEGHPGEREYGGCFVFRFDEATGELTPVVTDMQMPNGLAFSPDERVLYVSDTSASHAADGMHEIRAYDVTGDGCCENGRVFAEVEAGLPDGFRVDEAGRIWTSTRDGVLVFEPDGALVTSIAVPEVVSNVAFGGADGHDLYITGTTSLYRIRTTARSCVPWLRG